MRRSTYIGGRGVDLLGDVTVDAAHNVLLVGSTNSSFFPLRNAAQGELEGDKDAFVTKVSSTGEIVFSTYLGASEGDHATAVATDAAGNVYVFGYTFSYDFPTTPGALKERSAEDSQDAVLVKLTPAGEIVYSTRLGGEKGGELGSDVVVDATGSAYVSGWTDSEDFPTTGAPQEYGGSYDAYVSKVGPEGTELEFSRYLGGADLEGGGVLADRGDGVAVALTTYSRRLTTTGFQPRFGKGKNDAYVALLSSDGTLEAASYLGGSGTENVTAAGVDAGGALYVVGATGSADFPVRNAFQRRFGGRSDDDQYMAEGFVTKIEPDLSALVFSSFFGGGRDDGVGGVAVADSGAWLAGTTYSRDLPVRRALDRTWNGAADGWLARIVE